MLALAAAGPAIAGTQGAAHRDASHPVRTPRAGAARDVLRLHPMPDGTVRFGRQHGWLTVHAALFGLTPGSAHGVDLRLPGGGTVRFSPLTANAVGQARATLSSHYTGRLPAGSWLVIRMGTGRRGVATNPIAVTRPLAGGCISRIGWRPSRPARPPAARCAVTRCSPTTRPGTR